MKWLITLLLLGGLGYLGFTHKEEVLAKINSLRGISSPASGDANGDASASGAPGSPAAPKVFESKIAIPTAEAQPGEKHLAPAGVFYLKDRVKVENAEGIFAANPGEQVKLLERLPGDRMKVVSTDGNHTYEIKSSQATNDLDEARDAEKRNFLAHGGKL